VTEKLKWKNCQKINFLIKKMKMCLFSPYPQLFWTRGRAWGQLPAPCWLLNWSWMLRPRSKVSWNGQKVISCYLLTENMNWKSPRNCQKVIFSNVAEEEIASQSNFLFFCWRKIELEVFYENICSLPGPRVTWLFQKDPCAVNPWAVILELLRFISKCPKCVVTRGIWWKGHTSRL
jgi:hypothetical protein